MKRTSVCMIGVSAFVLTVPLSSAMADDMTTKAPPPPVAQTSSPVSCSSLWDFVATACPLTWQGVTVYGTIDTGVSWQSHSAPFNGRSSFGVNYLISKNSNRSLWLPGPNGMSQSNIGIKGNEPLGSDWSFIFDLQADFDPYSLQLANGSHSVAQNAGVPLTNQKLVRRFEPAGEILQRHGLCGRQFTDLWHPHGVPTIFADQRRYWGV